MENLQNKLENALRVIETAKDLAIYAGANNDRRRFQDDYFLAVADDLRELKDFVLGLADEIEALQLENDELKAQ